MSTTPIILSTGSSSGAGTAGEGRNDLVIGETISLSDTEPLNSGASYLWIFVDKPLDSSAVLINSSTSAPSFIPDVYGSYWVQCIVDSLHASNEILAVPLEATGARIPAWDENSEYDAAGNTKGWHESQTVWMREVDARLVGAYNVRKWGAKGDGVTNDTVALQNTIAAAGNRGTVYFPAGTYLTDELDITGVKLIGEHHTKHDTEGTIIKAVGGFTGTAVLFSDGLTHSNHGAQLENLIIEATGATYGVYFDKSTSVWTRLVNVTARNATSHGFYMKTCTSFSMKDCNASANGGDGIRLEGCNAGLVDHCDAASNSTAGIKVTRGAGGDSGGMTVRDCISQTNGGDGIVILGNSATNGNYVDAAKIVRCWVEQNGQTSGGIGINATYAGHAIIQGNRITPRGAVTSTERGISLTGSRLCTVRDNIVSKQTYDEYLRIKDDSSTASNLIENNYRYDNLVEVPCPVELLPDPFDLADGTALATAMGYGTAPDSFWRGNESSGAADLEGANDLTDSSTPSHNQFDANLKTNTVQFDGINDALVASGSSVFDITTGAFAILIIGWMTEIPNTAGPYSLMSKRVSGSGAGWDLQLGEDGYLSWVFDDGTTETIRTISRDHSGLLIALAKRRVTATADCRLWSNFGDTGAYSSAGTGSATNAATFAIGKGSKFSPYFRLAAAGIWTGSGSEALDGGNFKALKDYLGL